MHRWASGARFAAGNTQLAPQTESRHSVYETEIDGLCTAPFIVTHFLQGNPEYFRRGRTVNILPGLERLG